MRSSFVVGGFVTHKRVIVAVNLADHLVEVALEGLTGDFTQVTTLFGQDGGLVCKDGQW